MAEDLMSQGASTIYYYAEFERYPEPQKILCSD